MWYIKLGSPWENSYCVSLNSKLHGEFLYGENFYLQRQRFRPPANAATHFDFGTPVLALCCHPSSSNPAASRPLRDHYNPRLRRARNVDQVVISGWPVTRPGTARIASPSLALILGDLATSENSADQNRTPDSCINLPPSP
jgi:hypothetical protein